MKKRMRCLTLLVAMLWQTLAFFTPTVIADTVAFLDNAVEHSLAVSHHHHDDHALHMDVPGDDVDHLHTDAGSSFAGLLSRQPEPGPSVSPSAPLAIANANIPAPYLEGPLRPPQRLA